MADRNVIGMAMELDVTDITSGLSQVSKAITQSNTDFKKATAGMENWSKTSEGLTAKLDQLTTNLELQKKGASGLEAEIKRLQESEGDHSAEIERAKKKLDNYQIQIATTEKEIRKYTTALEDTQKKEQSSQSATSKLTDELKNQKSQLSDLEKEYKDAVLTYGKNSKEAQTLEKQIKKLSSEINDNEDKIKKADNAYKDITTSLSKTSKSADEVTKSISSIGKKGIITLGAVTASVTALAKKFLDTAESTKELRTNMAKVTASFEQAGFSADTAKTAYNELYAVLGDEGKTTEAVSHLSKLVETEEDLSTWTDICAGVYALFGDSIPIEGLTEASNETAKTGELTGQLGDALKRVGVSEDEFKSQLEQCNTEQERTALITNTLNSLYAETGRRYRENNADLIASNDANNKLAQSMADVGAMAEPIVTKLKQIGTQLLVDIMPTVQEIIPFVEANLPAIIKSVGILTAGITTLAGANLIYKTGVTALTIAQKALNLAMTANPAVLLAVAIGAVIAIIVTLWNKSEAFRNFWIGCWDKIKEAVTTGWENTVNFFKSLWTGIKEGAEQLGNAVKNIFSAVHTFIYNLFAGIGDWFKNRWDEAKQNTLKFGSDVKSIFSDIWKNIQTIFSGVSSWFGGIWDGAKNAIVYAFTDLPAQMIEVGKNLVTGIWDGITGATSWLTDKIKGFGTGVIDTFKGIFGIHSPSTETAEIGGYLDEGLWSGLSGMMDWLINNIKSLGKKLLEALGFNFNYSTGEEAGEEFGQGIAEGMATAQTAISAQQSVWRSQTEYWRKKQQEETEKAKSSWEKFGDGVKNALDKTDSYLTKWKSNTGKYLSQVAGYFDTAKGYLTDMGDAIYSYYEQENQQQQDALQEQIDTLKSNNAETIKQIEETGEKQLEEAKEIYESQLEQLETRLANGEITEEQYATAKEQRESAYATRKATLEQQISDTTTSIQQQTDEKEKELMAEKDRLGREAFEANKKVQIASIAVNTASAIIKAFAELGWIAGGIASVALGVTAGLQIAEINKQQYTPIALAKGGITQGATQALIGEDGKEAVLPLEKNTGWIDMLANKLNTVMLREGSVNSTAYGARNISNNYTQIINAPKTPSRRELYRDGKNLLALKGAF